MKIVTVASRKGGCGKTTLARAIAVHALSHGVRSVIIEADRQTAESQWSARRAGTGLTAPTIVGLFDGPTARRRHTEPRGILDDTLDDLRARGAGLVVVDTPPHDQPLISHIVSLSDAVAIPVQMTPNDLEGAGATVEIVRALARPAGLVINRAAPRTAGFRAAQAVLPTFGLPICPTALVERTAHQYADGAGMTALEYEPGKPAALEMVAVVEWINAALLQSSLWSR